MSNFTEIKALADMAASLLGGKDYFLGDIASRLDKAATKHPHDQAIRTMQLALGTKVKKAGKMSVISQKDIQSLYDDVSGLGNRVHFQEELGDLLLEDRVNKVATYNNDYVGGLRDSGEQLELVSRDAVNEFENLWRAPNEVQTKSAFIEGGRRGIEIELQALGFSQPTVEVTAKDDNFVVFAAEVSSRRGRVPFLIPAEIKLGSVLMPSVFVSGDEFKDLTTENVKSHINTVTKDQNHVSPQSVLATLNKLTGKTAAPKKAVASDSSFISMNTPELFMAQKEPTAPSMIDDKVPAVKLPEALVGLGESLITETLVEAGLSFDRNIVLAAKQVVANELRLAKVAFDTIKVSSEFNGGITLATNVVGKGGKKKVEIPVEIVNGRPQIPGTFTSGAFAGSFDESGLAAFANQIEGAAFDPMLSDKISMSFNQLHKLALRKAAYGNFIEATEILSIINEKFGHDYHRVAHDDMMELLKIGFSEDTKPLTAMEKFTIDATAKAKDKESQIKMMDNAMLFYPKE